MYGASLAVLVCESCEEQTPAPTVKRRYAENLNCSLRPLFVKLNDWRKVTMDVTTGADGIEESSETLFEVYMNDVEARLSEIVAGATAH